MELPTGWSERHNFGYQISEFNKKQSPNLIGLENRHFKPISAESIQRLPAYAKFRKESHSRLYHIAADGPEEFLEAILQLHKYFPHIAVFSISGSNHEESILAKPGEFNIDSHHIMYLSQNDMKLVADISQWLSNEEYTDGAHDLFRSLHLSDNYPYLTPIGFVLEDWQQNFHFEGTEWRHEPGWYPADSLNRAGVPLWYCWGVHIPPSEEELRLLEELRHQS